MPPKQSSPADTGDGRNQNAATELNLTLLRRSLHRYQEQCRVLESDNKRLRQVAETQSEDFKDIAEFMKREAAAKDLQIAVLQQRLAATEAELHSSTIAAEASAERLQSTIADSEIRQRRQLAEVEGKLQEAASAVALRSALEKEKAQLDAALELERKAHEKQIGAMERARVQDKDDWQRNSDIQLQHAVAAAEKAVMLHGLSKCDIDAQLQYQAQQAGYMYDRMKEATQRMNSMRRELQVSEENQAQAIKHSRALQHTVDIMSKRLREQIAAREACEAELLALMKQAWNTRLDTQSGAATPRALKNIEMVPDSPPFTHQWRQAGSPTATADIAKARPKTAGAVMQSEKVLPAKPRAVHRLDYKLHKYANHKLAHVA